MPGWLLAGDVVTSLRFTHHRALLTGLDACLASVNRVVAPVVALHRVAHDRGAGG